MAYWLVKSEPSSYSWDQLVADPSHHWNGVRNAQALNNLPDDEAR
jgi:predicted RNA-binding protein with PUA-like domain